VTTYESLKKASVDVPPPSAVGSAYLWIFELKSYELTAWFIFRAIEGSGEAYREATASRSDAQVFVRHIVDYLGFAAYVFPFAEWGPAESYGPPYGAMMVRAKVGRPELQSLKLFEFLPGDRKRFHGTQFPLRFTPACNPLP